MWKNVASQKIVAQLVATADGSAVTSGTTNVYLSGDGSYIGAAGNTTATHLGNGTWVYNTTAGDTNYDHVALTFVNTSSISATIQVFTSNKFVADVLAASANTMLTGVVGSSSTTTSVITSSIAMAGGNTSIGTNALAGRRIYFSGATSTANARNVGGRITANTSGTTPTLTIDSNDTFPTAPLSGDVFVIV